MSVPWVDYIPFNYEGYIREILPIWRQAMNGQVQPLRSLIQIAPHFSLWSCFHCALELPGYTFERLAATNWRLLLARNRALQEPEDIVRPWEMLWDIAFEGAVLDEKKYRNPRPYIVSMLHMALVSTFCCDLPAPEEDVNGDQPGSARGWVSSLIGNEGVPVWEEYINRDKETQTLWKTFYEPAPPDLAHRLFSPTQPQHKPRSSFRFPLWEEPSGLLTAKETEHLYVHLPRRGTLSQSFWIKEEFSQITYDWLWKMEEMIMGRAKFAFERGWGLLLIEC